MMTRFCRWGGTPGLISVFCVMLGVGCNPRSDPGSKQTQADSKTAPSDLEWVKPIRQALLKSVEQPGTVEPFEETPLFAKVPGFVSMVRTDIGQRVKGPVKNAKGDVISPGDILAEVSIPEMVEEASQKEALVGQAESEVHLAEKGVGSAEAQLFAMEALVQESKAAVRRSQAVYERWEADLSRVNTLIQRGIADAQTRDQIQGEFRSATAGRDEANAKLLTAEANARKTKADLERAKAMVSAAKSHVNVAKAEARRLVAMLSYTQIRAPYDGIITKRKVNTGDLLNPGRVEPLFMIARFEPLRLVVYVPETEAALVQEKTPIRLRVQAIKGLELKGLISRTSWSLDPGARTLRAEIDLPNPGERLRPGMYVYASIEGTLPEAWTLPASAVVKQGDGLACFRLADGKLARTPVQAGHSDGKRIEVLKWQVSEGVWSVPTAENSIAQKASGLSHGMAITLQK